MKKIFLSLLMASLLVSPVLGFVQAADPAESTSIMPSSDGTAGEGLPVAMVDGKITDTLTQVANYVVGILLLIAVFYVLWAAYTFMTSSGETEKVSQARSRIMYAGIGVVVALLAKGIVSLVLSAVK